MLRTEDEARKCWCPFVKLHVSGGGLSTPAHNRATTIEGEKNGYDGNVAAVRCLAASCMAWVKGPLRAWIVAEDRFAEIGEAVTVQMDGEMPKPGQVERRDCGWGRCGMIEHSA